MNAISLAKRCLLSLSLRPFSFLTMDSVKHIVVLLGPCETAPASSACASGMSLATTKVQQQEEERYASVGEREMLSSLSLSLKNDLALLQPRIARRHARAYADYWWSSVHT